MRRVAAGIFIAAFFIAFTWRGALGYFTGDDMMNLYGYWSHPASDLIKANFLFWTPYYRPFGGVIYRTIFALFGFNPRPLYIFYYVSLLLNLWIAYLVFKRISQSAEIGALATLLWSAHGCIDYLAYSAGSMYDVYCFSFFFLALLIYSSVRMRGEYLKGWSLAAFVASFVCCLNSKEMGATLPVILIAYELLFHRPRLHHLHDAGRWLIREGRGALLSGMCLIGYIPAKMSFAGLAGSPAYVCHFTWPTFLHDTGVYLGLLTYRTQPFSPTEIVIFYAALAVAALLLRSRRMWFGLLFFQITLLPVSFVTARQSFVLYLPTAGLALYFGVLLTWIAERAFGAGPRLLRMSRAPQFIVLLVSTAAMLGVIHNSHRLTMPGSSNSPYRITKEQLSRMYPRMNPGASLLFAASPLDGEFFDLLFTLSLMYSDHHLFVTQLNGPEAQRLPIDKLGHYDHIFSYENGRFVELDNADTRRSLRLHLVKEEKADAPIGENMMVSGADAYRYFVRNIVGCLPKSMFCWTLESPELKFRLSSNKARFFTVHFKLSEDALKQTGPLKIDYFINDHLLERAQYFGRGDHTYQHRVPDGWLRTDDYTVVKMQVHNPYIASGDGAKLGILLVSAGFRND